MSEWRRRQRWFPSALGCVVAAVGPGCSRDDPDDLWYRARVDSAAGRLAEAETDLARLAWIRPLTVPERMLRAKVASDRGRIDEALAALADPQGPTKGPEAAFIASRRGELEMARGRSRAAEAELNLALALDPGRVEARRRLIMLYAQQGRSAEVAAHASLLASSEKLDFLDLYAWTLARNPPLDRTEVAEVLGRAVQADPGDRASRLALAECLRRRGRLDQADSTLDALPLTDPAARAARARVALDRGDGSGAEALLDADLDGDDLPALARLRGRLALSRRDAPAAVRHFRAALEAAPDDRDTQFGLAEALRQAGQPEAARRHAEDARAQDHLESMVESARPTNRRNDPATLQAIGEACLALDRRDEARAWYRLALSHDPANAHLKNALSQLDSTHSAKP
jgi:tetratricopeptide (TPR) repeat protein